MTTITVSNASQLQSALAAAKPGDVVLLANGEYGTVTIDRNYSADVTIKAQNPLGAKFDQIIVNNSSHLVFDGIHVDSPSNGTSGPGLIDIN